jgi:hypothetical protein
MTFEAKSNENAKELATIFWDAEVICKLKDIDAFFNTCLNQELSANGVYYYKEIDKIKELIYTIPNISKYKYVLKSSCYTPKELYNLYNCFFNRKDLEVLSVTAEINNNTYLVEYTEPETYISVFEIAKWHGMYQATIDKWYIVNPQQKINLFWILPSLKLPFKI